MNDLGYALRQLSKNPGFTAMTVLCLTLGIGATSGIFSVVNAVLLRPLPYAHPERLSRLYTEFPTFPNGGLRRFAFSAPEYLDLQRDATSWEAVEAWRRTAVNLVGEQEPTRVTAAQVTGGMLEMLGVAPLSGRLLNRADDEAGAPLAADISFGLWQRVFGGARDVIGREILVNGTKCTVIGVMPKDYRFPPGEVDPPELWIPLQINPARPGSRSSHGLAVLGRLKPGLSLEQARAELAALVLRSQQNGSTEGHPFNSENHTLVVYGLHDEVVGSIKPALHMLLGAVGFVLLIACVNVANLLLARAEARQREIAIRGALGASLRRLTWQFVTEGLVLSLAGAAFGLLLAQGGLQLVKATSEASIPRALEINIDTRVILFAIALCAGTGIVFGLTPILHATKQKFHESLKSSAASTTGSAPTHRFRQALVVSELALALVLLIGSGLMLRAFWKLQEVNAGFDSAALITGSLSLPQATYPNDAARLSLWTRLHERLNGLPGVEGAALVSSLAPVKSTRYQSVRIEGFVPVPGGPVENVDFLETVSHDYHKTLRIPLLEGRLFDSRDAAGTPEVAIVNQAMARTFWGDESPIGRRLRPVGTNWCTVIGVVADVKNHGLDKSAGTEVYLPLGQTAAGGDRSLCVVVRARHQPALALKAVQREIRDLDPALPLARVRTMDEVMAAAQSRPRFLTMLLTIFSSVALALAAVGIYGVISYSVAQRTREFGVRMALGASRGDVLSLVLGRGLLLTGLGVAVGLGGALLLTRFLTKLLFGIGPTDPFTFTVVSLGLALVACLASYLPARRATKVDPMIALRYE